MSLTQAYHDNFCLNQIKHLRFELHIDSFRDELQHFFYIIFAKFLFTGDSTVRKL